MTWKNGKNERWINQNRKRRGELLIITTKSRSKNRIKKRDQNGEQFLPETNKTNFCPSTVGVLDVKFSEFWFPCSVADKDFSPTNKMSETYIK